LSIVVALTAFCSEKLHFVPKILLPVLKIAIWQLRL